MSGKKCLKRKKHHSEGVFSLRKFLAGEFQFFQDMSNRSGQQIYELHKCVILSSSAQRGKKRRIFNRFDGHGSSRASRSGLAGGSLRIRDMEDKDHLSSR